MRDKKEIQKWVEHIIRRFGKEDALYFAISNVRCPCISLARVCYGCKYQETPTRRYCKAANQYDKFISDDYFYSRKRCVRRKRKIKKIIFKRVR